MVPRFLELSDNAEHGSCVRSRLNQHLRIEKTASFTTRYVVHHDLFGFRSSNLNTQLPSSGLSQRKAFDDLETADWIEG